MFRWRYTRRGDIPFSPSWWVFVFPPGAYTLSTLSPALRWRWQPLEGPRAIFTLALLWLLVTWRTPAGLRSGHLWKR